ncbi:MAG TPA: nuclear transport factor 2 family protein [Polyangia bacterium]|nr:nuclear transport factor 2 family protein [Polyangia bacterium]
MTKPEPSTPEELSLKLAEAINAADLDRATGLFAVDARFVAVDARLIEGRAAIRDVLQALLAKRPTMSVVIERMIETPRGAVGSVLWTISFERDGERPAEESGRSTVVFARAADGWEILVAAPWGLTPDGRPQAIEELALAARNALSNRGRRLDEIGAEDGLDRAPGLFAIHADATGWRHLGLGEPPDERPLYVGMASGRTSSRSLKNHIERPFAAGTSSDISLRRSFAALLAAELELAPITRRTPAQRGNKPGRYLALEESAGRRLSEWMRANLRIAVWVWRSHAPLAEIRATLWEEWLPPLCLIDITTPWTKQVKAARAALAEQAKERMERANSEAEAREK